jgi:hypothetical protein
MTDSQDVVTCPLCKGHGEIRRAELADRRNDGELKSRVDATLGGLEPAEEAAMAAQGNESRNFQKDVHSWNPQLPMWRRSPKE